MWYPTCAYACNEALSGYRLECSVATNGTGGRHGGGSSRRFMTSPDCYATDDRFLWSVAYCINTHCSDISVSDIEHFWATYFIGSGSGQFSPKEPYSVALLHADPPPAEIVDSEPLLNRTTLVSEQEYAGIYNSDSHFEQMEVRQNDFGLILLITGVIIPIAFSLLRFVPFPNILVSRFNSYFIDPPVFGHRHREPFHKIGLVPTRGQALLIAYFVFINVVLSCADYRLIVPNSWQSAESDQLLVYITNRQGVLSFANLPLLILYSGRNNFLLWMTNWSHSTFLLIHRWIAIICTIEACLHSAIYLQIYIADDRHAEASKLPFWIWGVIATLALCIMLPVSILPLRQKLYNLFLASHFVFALLALIGCYYHIIYRYDHWFGYETWIYIAFAVWAFDRLARFARLARNGIRTAQITIVDEDYVCVEIPGVTAQGHAYLYFPMLGWRIWENHPFSVVGTMMLQDVRNTQHTTTDVDSSTPPSDVEKAPTRAPTISSLCMDGSFAPQPFTGPSFKPGLTFFVRTTTKGLTATLRSKSKTPVLVESSYGASSLDELRTTPNCVVIAGGVGIGAVAPLLRTRAAGRVRLFWGVRSKQLVDAVKTALGPDFLAPSIVGNIAVGKRLNLRAILEREVVGDAETAVVVCGPVTMADEVRAIVCDLGRKGRPVRLVDEAFSW
ncbi:ferric reductase like transmembrane component-domain-containing protein [Hypoxylon crocopeplum]|nr:ferric reductase like transmembrane component-domain-containing protein [Hypoxylon crocopeplum]